MIVVDGIWDIEDWIKLVKFFPDDNVGSGILATSTDVELATRETFPESQNALM